jgi:primase-polymerase (primpol)-like protein
VKCQVTIENIPEELRKRKQWVCWDAEKDDKGNPTKVPYFSRTKGKQALIILKTSHPDI